MTGYAPRKRDYIDAEIVFVYSRPSIILVVDNPLKSVHSRLIELLLQQIVLKWACPDICSYSHIN